MSVTQIDIDDEALAEAMRLMGTTTKKDTVNTALREYAERVRRLEAAEKLAARAARGEFDGVIAAGEAAKAARKAALGDWLPPGHVRALAAAAHPVRDGGLG